MRTPGGHILALLLPLSALCAGCGSKALMSISVESFGEMAYYGGRNRIVCSWDGVPEEVSSIRFTLGGTTYEASEVEPRGTFCIGSLQEGTLGVRTAYLTADGHSYSLSPAEVTVYGEKYEQALENRAIVKYGKSEGGAFVVLSSEVPEGLTLHRFTYLDKSLQTKTLEVRARRCEQTVSIEDFGGGEILYRSIYSPCTHLEEVYASSERSLVFRDRPDIEDAPTVDGYRGIWFSIGQAKSDYGPKYSGGLGTYTMKHIPMAVYAPEVKRTYFVYGGCPESGKSYLQCMIGCYDHASGKLQKPRVVMDKGKDGVSDPHDDPTIQIDRDGYIWVFVAGRGNKRNGVRYRSAAPFDITAFEYVGESIMAYPQVMYSSDRGFFLFFTRYDGVRQLFYQSSPDGVNWSAYRQLASIKEGTETKSGHYQISNICGTKLCTAFNRHINGGVDTRTNIYYLQSEDWGETWTRADGERVETPVTERYSSCLIADYQSEGRNCYIKDLNFDSAGNPVILYLTSDNHLTGPSGGTRQWHTMYWTGSEWRESRITTSTHCYDSGSIWVEDDIWTVIAPTATGPQYWGAGGEMVMWRSCDRGISWTEVRQLTGSSERNHTYARRPLHSDRGFYAFWADGNPNALSISYLYYCTASGEVYRMPYEMSEEWEAPELMTYN